jgi:ribosomal protein S18 acetylase RimI-like enzyme
MSSRAATVDDIELIAATIAHAFLADPVWGVALARADGATGHLNQYWRVFVESAVSYATAFVADDGSAVSVWIPPGEPELSDVQKATIDDLARTHLDAPAVRALHELWERFDANHPQDEPHAYLSLLAAHSDHRGRGAGQQLLSEDLARFDARGLAAFLESTNPANDHRYARAGFQRIGGFSSVIDGAPISTMWRAGP